LDWRKVIVGRSRFNSDTIRKNHPNAYNDLFVSSSIVTSASGSFYWSGEHLVMYGGPSVIQKIPVRTWVGIRKSSTRGIQFNDWKVFLDSESGFLESPFPKDIATLIESLVLPMISEYTDSPGLEVDTLFEFTPASGLNSSGAMSAALATALFLHGNKITSHQLDIWRNQSIMQSLADPVFDQVFRLAWKLDAAISGGGYSSGGGSLAALVSAEYPIIYWSERRYDDEENPLGARYPVDIEQNYELLDSINVSGARLEELFDLPTGKGWPINYGLIFTAKQKLTSDVTGGIANYRRAYAERSANSLKSLSDVTAYSGSKPAALGLSDKTHYHQWWDSILSLGTSITANLLQELCESIHNPVDDSTIRPFIKSVNHYYKFLDLMGVENKDLEEICTELRLHIEKDFKTFAGVKTTGAGNSGDVVFAFRRYGIARGMENVERHLQEKIDPRIRVHYMSWIDDTGGEGVRTHLFLDRNIFPSEWPNKGLSRLMVFGKQRYQQIIMRDQINNYVLSFDLAVIDLPSEWGILIRGDVPDPPLKTIKATVDILKQLLLSEGQPIYSYDGWPGSYAELGQFRSKILSPLEEALENQIGQKLDLTIIPREGPPPPGITSGKVFDVSLKVDSNLEVALLTTIG
jgi:mevalonate kinase